MEISKSIKNGSFHVALIGQICQKEELRELEQIISSCVLDNRKTVVLDLQRISFINSQGLGLIVRFYNCMTNAENKLILLVSRSSILEIFEISGFCEFMTIAKSNQELMDILNSLKMPF